jgi:hypothetical protein
MMVSVIFTTYWLELLATATIIPIFVAAIILMFGRFFDSKQLEQAAKTELVFAGSTVVLVLALIIILPIADSILLDVANSLYNDVSLASGTPAFSPAGSTTLIDYTFLFMKPYTDCMGTLLNALYYFSTFFEMSSTTYIEVFMSEVSSGFVYKIITERIINVTNILSFYYYIYFLMFNILSFMKLTAIYLFLPIGVILRAFPPFRGAGAYIIAFSIGIYFIFPMSYIMAVAVNYQYTYSATFCAIDADTSEQPPAGSMFSPSNQKESESWIKRHISQVSSSLDKIQLDIFKKLTISLCLVPLMAMVITLTFILSSTSLFGGNIPEVGRGLVKLI